MSTKWFVAVPPEAMWRFSRETQRSLISAGCILGETRLAEKPVAGDLVYFFLATRDRDDTFRSYTTWRVLHVVEQMDLEDMGLSIQATLVVEPYDAVWTVAGSEYVREWALDYVKGFG